jgi:hypothetical protein
MLTSNERAAFEHWFSDEGKNPRAVERSDRGYDHYRLAQAETSWTAWRAAWAARGDVPPSSPLLNLILRLDAAEGLSPAALGSLQDMIRGAYAAKAAPHSKSQQKRHAALDELREGDINPHCLRDGIPCASNGAGGCVACVDGKGTLEPSAAPATKEALREMTADAQARGEYERLPPETPAPREKSPWTLALTAEMKREVVVCSACERACCWQGEFMCDHADLAGTKRLTVLELTTKPRGENAEYWFKDGNGVIDHSALEAYRGQLSEKP